MLPELVPEKGLALSTIAGWIGTSLIGIFYPTLEYNFTIGKINII